MIIKIFTYLSKPWIKFQEAGIRILFIIGLVAHAGCGDIQTNQIDKNTFQKIDYSDPNYSAFLPYSTKDTVLESGYSIDYFVVDSSKYDDLYIVWGQGLPKDTLLAASFLTVDDYEFIPILVEENDKFLILNFDCAQEDCSGSVFLNKTQGKGGYIFQGVLWYSVDRNIVIFNERLYSSAMDSLYIQDLEKSLRRVIHFEQERIFDSAYSDNNYITLKTKSADKNKTEYIQIIELKK